MNKFLLSYPAGRLDFELCVASGQVFRWERLPSGQWIGVDGEHWYLVEAPSVAKPQERLGHEALTQATGINRDPTRDALAYVAERRESYGESVDSLTVQSNATKEDLSSFFRLDWNADELEREIVARAPEMERYLGTMTGLRLLRPSDPIEMFFGFMCSPNNNLPRIVQMVRYLATLGPVFDEVEGKAIHRFPRTEVIASIDPLSLRAKAFGYRAETIPSAARQVMDRGGDAWIEGLKDQPYDSVHAQLIEIKGIGPKLADCIALFALHHTEAVPVDTHLWQAAVRIYFPEWKDKPLTDARYKLVSELFRRKFGSLTGWAHQFLFYDNMLNWRSRK